MPTTSKIAATNRIPTSSSDEQTGGTGAGGRLALPGRDPHIKKLYVFFRNFVGIGVTKLNQVTAEVLTTSQAEDTGVSRATTSEKPGDFKAQAVTTEATDNLKL